MSSTNKKTQVICHKVTATPIGYNLRLWQKKPPILKFRNYKLAEESKYLTVFPAKNLGKRGLQNYSRKWGLLHQYVAWSSVFWPPLSSLFHFLFLSSCSMVIFCSSPLLFIITHVILMIMGFIVAVAIGIGDQCSNKGMKKFTDELSQWSKSNGYCL